MRCPRCRSEILQSPCSQCGFIISTGDQFGPFSQARAAQSEDQLRNEYAFVPKEDRGKVFHHPQIVESIVRKQQDPLRASSAVVPQSKDVSPQRTHLSTETQGAGGRFRLSEKQEQQLWGIGIRETWWKAFDDERKGKHVTICDVVSGQRSSGGLSLDLTMATTRLAQISRHPSAPALLGTYRDRGHDYFVFEAVEGESLISRMRREKQTLPVREVLECCLFLTEGIEYFSRLLPPLIHGRISPEHLVQTQAGWMLINFSPIVASGAQPAITGMDHTNMSFLYAASSFVQGDISVRADLYALLATAYYAVTRMIPSSGRGSILQAQRLNPAISVRFNAILTKGLHPLPGQRYQNPFELRLDLQEALSGSRSVQRQQWAMPPVQGVTQSQQQIRPSNSADPVAQAFSFLAPAQELNVPEGLLPPGEFSSVSPRKDLLTAMSWLLIMLICLLVIISVSRGLL